MKLTVKRWHNTILYKLYGLAQSCIQVKIESKIKCTNVKYLNRDEKFNVMFLTWWCSLCALERGLTNGYGHSSIYCNQQSNWKIKMSCVYSDNLFNITLYLDFCWSRGRIRPRMKHPCLYLIFLSYFTKMLCCCWMLMFSLCSALVPYTISLQPPM